MSWHASLQLDYRRDGMRSVVHDRHDGPLRILQSLYPEGASICHNVLVHPPGGLVGGDTLAIALSVGPAAHGLLTTPGATRFYRSSGALAPLVEPALELLKSVRAAWRQQLWQLEASAPRVWNT